MADLYPRWLSWVKVGYIPVTAIWFLDAVTELGHARLQLPQCISTSVLLALSPTHSIILVETILANM